MSAFTLRGFLLVASFLGPAITLAAQTPSFELSRDGYQIFGAENVAQGDFNNDGKPDLVFDGSDSASSSDIAELRLGNGDGTFQPPRGIGVRNTSFATNDMIAADVDQDGKLDLVMVTSAGVYVFFGNGDGTFQPQVVFPTSAGGRSVTVGHFFGDTWLDIATGEDNGTVELFRNTSGRAFTLGNTVQVGAAAYPGVTRVRDGNLDGTGLDSIAAQNFSDGGVYVLWGQNDGTFQVVQLATYAAPADINVGNLDQDGIDDILVSYTCNPTSLNNPDKGPTYQACQGLDVFYGQGDHQFIQNTVVTNPNSPAGGMPWAVDVNGDGIGDIVLGGGSSSGSLWGMDVYVGNADGSFSQTPYKFYTTTDGTGNVVPGDWNRDGAIDFAAAMPGNAQQEIYINGGSRAACSNYTINDSVTVCMPSNYAYLPSPVTVQANTTDNNTVVATQQYIDDQLAYDGNQPSFTQSFDLAPGPHFLVTKAWDDTGLSFRSDRLITVYSGTPYPACPAAPNAASICLPSGATSSSPVHILANGYASWVPTAAQLYIDGNLVVNNQGCPQSGGCGGGVSYVDTIQSLSSGDHDLVFKLWDANGNLYQAEKMVTVD